MTINEWIIKSSGNLSAAKIASARLDAELILTHTLKKGRTYLHAHGDEELDARYFDILDTRLALRLDRVPLAYIIGHKDFYGRSFKVTPSTLIPRPESEAMVELLLETARQQELPLSGEDARLVDIGTGSGNLGITAKLEIPELEVTLLDTSRHALTIAEENAKRLQADVTLMKSDLLGSYPFKSKFILANLPYVGEDWDVSPETIHEPQDALYAGNDGLALIYRLLGEASSRLSPNGIIFIESDIRQQSPIKDFAKKQGYKLHDSRGLILSFQLT